MNVQATLRDIPAQAEADTGARTGMRQAWLKSLEQAWRDHSRSSTHAGHEGRQVPPSAAAEDGMPAAKAPVAQDWSGSGHEIAARVRVHTAAEQGMLQAQAFVPLAAAVRVSAAQPIPAGPMAVPATPIREVPAPYVLRDVQSAEAARRQASPMLHDPLPLRHLAALPEAGGLAVWVRDGSLADADSRRLTDGLRRAAREAGVNLRRVAVNGRTVYETTETPAAGDAANLLTRARS